MCIFLRIGNPVAGGKNPEKPAEICAPCANSDLTLKRQISMLDDMVLVDGDADDSAPTDDEESVV
jgi:hypothetical protein